jgi:transcriptional regulator with XRE-family HTH domain
MEMEQALGEVLRSVRKQRGLSQEALALNAGVERNYISLIELGRNSPSIRILYKICKVLDISPSLLLAHAEEHMRVGTKKKGQGKR